MLYLEMTKCRNVIWIHLGKCRRLQSNNLFQLKLNADLYPRPNLNFDFIKVCSDLVFIPEVKASKPHLGPKAQLILYNILYYTWIIDPSYQGPAQWAVLTLLRRMNTSFMNKENTPSSKYKNTIIVNVLTGVFSQRIIALKVGACNLIFSPITII